MKTVHNVQSIMSKTVQCICEELVLKDLNHNFSTILTVILNLTLTVYKIVSYMLSKQCQQCLSLCLSEPSRLLLGILLIRLLNRPNTFHYSTNALAFDEYTHDECT